MTRLSERLCCVPLLELSQTIKLMNRPASYFETSLPTPLPATYDLCPESQCNEIDGVGPLFVRGNRMIIRRERMLLPICLNNGYYTREQVFKLLLFASQNSKQVSVFFTDGPARHNYRAIGKTEEEARRECHRHLNRLRNHCHAAIAKINAGNEISEHFLVTFIDWKSIYTSCLFQNEYHRLLTLYQQNECFREDVRRTTHEVLRKKVAVPLHELCLQQFRMNSIVDIAVHYSLEELAFLMTYAKYGDFGAFTSAEKSDEAPLKPFVYVYYQRWHVFERLAEGFYDRITHPEIGFYLID
jgi:tRNA-dependent cyclodipeptide synthase